MPCVKLFQPSIVDFSSLQKNDDVKIVIKNTKHKFATDAEFSGTDVKHQPIFGSTVYINGTKFSTQSFGLPFLRFSQGSKPKITYENRTRYTFNVHYHGLNVSGNVDGTSMETVFGHSTLLGPKVTFDFPEITNNQSLLWFHSHNMFVSMELIYGGIVGLLQIVDEPTKWLTEDFQYGDNQILLMALDMDLTNTGTQTDANLIVDENRSSFAVINGTSAINWYSSEQNTPFVDDLYHTTTKNLVKIDILNASLNWRVFYIGVCDDYCKIKSFYQIQTDSGLMNPTKLKMASISVASRIGIIIDLNKFKNHNAYLFFYNYDLTEIFNTTLAFPDQPNNPTLIGTVPDLNASENPTPYPTPIPDPNQENQQGDFTNLDYPIVGLIPQTNEVLANGSIRPPQNKRIKPFLKISPKEKHKLQNLDLNKTISRIRKNVFGENYDQYKSLFKTPCFEYDPKFNYLSFLNKNYFYNLPNFDIDVPTRNLFLFSEANTNALASGNVNGVTEFVNGANRIMADLWNSSQLDLDFALQQYMLTPNNYKPPVLPTSKFRIFKTNDKFSNTAMISNDSLQVQIFTQPITYGDTTSVPIASVKVVFPPTNPYKLLNLQEWIDLVNLTFRQTSVNLPNLTNLSNILQCDWSFFPYALDFLYQKTAYVKSAVIKTTNSTNYYIRFLGRWPILQFFGKPLTGDTLNPSSSLLSQLRAKQNIRKNKKSMPTTPLAEMKGTKTEDTQLIKNSAGYLKCDEESIYGIYDSNIQQIFPFYATSDGNVQIPIACMKRNAELIIPPQQTYIGFYDGYLNDNLNSFSVMLKSTEIWIYTNGDSTDSHPLHFHLTSGFASPQSKYDSPGLLSCKRLYDPLIYTRDVYKIGPQETVSFYLTWPHYSSDKTTKDPKLRNLGGFIHCHFLQHNDANGMIIQYFVESPLLNSGNCE
jgi:FtsP/CotA-like multicopper oxidase with cupredoxin domain